MCSGCVRLAASIVALLTASQDAAARAVGTRNAGPKVSTNFVMTTKRPKRRHRWGVTVRAKGRLLSIRTCEKCGLVMYSRHSVDDDGVIDHWKEYYTVDAPDVELRTMPECGIM